MAAQSEREPGVVVMSSVVGRPMVQDTPVQDIPIPEQDESLPQTNPEPEMGAAAAEAAVHDTSHPPLYQNPRPWPNRLSRLRSTWPSRLPYWQEWRRI